jgi:nitrogen fixation NifU-like protein
MDELRELYQEMILDHGKRPRNALELPDADHKAEGYNPLCGDRLTVYAKTDGDNVERVTFQGTGCAISVASASLMSEALAGKSRDEIEELFRLFHALVTGKGDTAAAQERLGKLMVLAGVREFPVRVKCATLAWHTLRAALERQKEPVSTE